MKQAILVLSILLAACAKDPGNTQTSVAANPTAPLLISDIPRGCEFHYVGGALASGNHGFSDGLFPAVGFDCGIREGQHCYYYMSTGVIPQRYDIRCQ